MKEKKVLNEAQKNIGTKLYEENYKQIKTAYLKKDEVHQ